MTEFRVPTVDGEASFAAEPRRVDGRLIARTAVEFRDGTEGRVYVAADGAVYPSVSTVVGARDADTTGLDRWKATHDGSAGSADWRDLLRFKSAVGTLVHEAVLAPLADRDLWGAEEAASTAALDGLGTVDHPEALAAWLAETGGADAAAMGELAVAWCRDNAESVLADVVRPLGVERFLIDDDRGYAGQVDLVYETDQPGADRAVCDLKTSKRVYHKHRLQAEAYAAALDGDVDLLKVARLDPYEQSTEASYHYQWVDPSSRWDDPVTREGLRADLKDLAARVRRERLPVRRVLSDGRE